MTEYRLAVIGVQRPQELKPGTATVDVLGDISEVKEHYIQAKDDEDALQGAEKIVNSYLENLAAWNWKGISSAKLYKLIKYVL